MITSRLNRVVWTFLALILSFGNVFSSQQNELKSKPNSDFQKSCINYISGLSDYQKERIVSMEAIQIKVMSELQEKLQTSSGKEQKEVITKLMEKQTENHQNAIKSVLSADQQKQFILHQINGENQNNRAQNIGKGSGHGNGSGLGQGRGRGMGNSRF